MQLNLEHAGARGKFITFEGVDGAGKSTQLKAFCEQLRTRLAGIGKRLIVTREPGGTPLGENLRDILLHQSMHIETEALLMFAARREHIACVIEPALAQGDWVVSDRFTDATFAYQGGGRGMPAEKLKILEDWVQGTLQPDLTILLDLPVDIARERSFRRAQENQNPMHDPTQNNDESDSSKAQSMDKFESESIEFFSRIRTAYLARAAQVPQRYLVVDATQSVEVLQRKLASLFGECV